MGKIALMIGENTEKDDRSIAVKLLGSQVREERNGSILTGTQRMWCGLLAEVVLKGDGTISRR